MRIRNIGLIGTLLCLGALFDPLKAQEMPYQNVDRVKGKEARVYSPKVSIGPISAITGASKDRFHDFNRVRTSTIDLLFSGNDFGLTTTWDRKGMTDFVVKACREHKVKHITFYGELNTSLKNGNVNACGRLDYHIPTSYCELMPQLSLSREFVHETYSLTPALVLTKGPKSVTINCSTSDMKKITPTISYSRPF
jgi:hypothetical protein